MNNLNREEAEQILVDYGADTIAYMSGKMTQEQREEKRQQHVKAINQLLLEARIDETSMALRLNTTPDIKRVIKDRIKTLKGNND